MQSNKDEGLQDDILANTYSCESGLFMRCISSKIQVAEMKYLRRIQEITKFDRIGN